MALAESTGARPGALAPPIRVHESGHEGLRAMRAAIREARRSIHLETYLLRDDRVGRDFAEGLAAAVARGVEVRVLYDGLSAVVRGGAVRRAMRRAGVQLAAFNPLRELLHGRSPRLRDHRKLLIVDDEIAFVGGLNIGEEYDAAAVVESPEDETGWRDTELALRGPVVTALTRVFARAWNRTRVGRRSLDPAGGASRAAVLAAGGCAGLALRRRDAPCESGALRRARRARRYLEPRPAEPAPEPGGEPADRRRLRRPRPAAGLRARSARSVELTLRDVAQRSAWDRILDEICRLGSRLV